MNCMVRVYIPSQFHTRTRPRDPASKSPRVLLSEVGLMEKLHARAPQLLKKQVFHGECDTQLILLHCLAVRDYFSQYIKASLLQLFRSSQQFFFLLPKLILPRTSQISNY